MGEVHLPAGRPLQPRLPRPEVLPQAAGVRIRKAAQLAAIRMGVTLRTVGSQAVARVAHLRVAISRRVESGPLLEAVLLVEHLQEAARQAR